MKREKNSLRIIHQPHPDATPEGELEALAAIYAFVLKCGQQRRKAGVVRTGEDGKEINDVPANPILPR